MTTETHNELIQAIKWDHAGLVPAVVQDAQSKEVLMLAYMSKESLQLSIESGVTWYWSRSRNELWNKGATSGNTQRIVAMSYDCDGDTLLVKVEQKGPACHTGRYSCFYQPIIEQEAPSTADRFGTLGQLEGIIAQRYAERPEGSYTSYLFDKGVDKILKKVGEEASEVIIAAKNLDNDELRSEVGDLIFHLMVLLRERGLPLDDVITEINNRHGKQATNKMR